MSTIDVILPTNMMCHPTPVTSASTTSASRPSFDDEANADGIRSLRWLKRRVCGSASTAGWYDFPDIAAIHAMQPTPRQLASLRQHLASLDVESCGNDDCVFVDRRFRLSIHGTSYPLARLIYLLCAKNYTAADRVGTLCPCPPQTFVNGRLVVQTVDNPSPNLVLCCVNPRHFIISRPPPAPSSSLLKRRRREDAESDVCIGDDEREWRFDVTREILAEHLCPLLGGALPFKIPRAIRRAMPAKRPPEAYSQEAALIYPNDRRRMFQLPAGVRAAEARDVDDEDDLRLSKLMTPPPLLLLPIDEKLN